MTASVTTGYSARRPTTSASRAEVRSSRKRARASWNAAIASASDRFPRMRCSMTLPNIIIGLMAMKRIEKRLFVTRYSTPPMRIGVSTAAIENRCLSGGVGTSGPSSSTPA